MVSGSAAQDCASREWYKPRKPGSKLKLHIILVPETAGKAPTQTSRSLAQGIFNIICLYGKIYPKK